MALTQNCLPLTSEGPSWPCPTRRALQWRLQLSTAGHSADPNDNNTVVLMALLFFFSGSLLSLTVMDNTALPFTPSAMESLTILSLHCRMELELWYFCILCCLLLSLLQPPQGNVKQLFLLFKLLRNFLWCQTAETHSALFVPYYILLSVAIRLQQFLCCFDSPEHS